MTLFFPDGESQHGCIGELNYEMRDFKQCVLDRETTVMDLYQRTKVKMLRVYLCTMKQREDIRLKADNRSDDGLPEKSPVRKVQQQKKGKSNTAKTIGKRVNLQRYKNHTTTLGECQGDVVAEDSETTNMLFTADSIPVLHTIDVFETFSDVMISHPKYQHLKPFPLTA